MTLSLSNIRGRGAGACTGGSSTPNFTGTVSENGLIRIDSDNYPEHYQVAQLPEEWVAAYKAYKKRSADSQDDFKERRTSIIYPKVYTETGELSDKPYGQACREILGLPGKEVHADQAWVIDEAGPDYSSYYQKNVSQCISWAFATGDSAADLVQLMVSVAEELEPYVIERFTDQSFEDIDGVYKALDCGLFGDNTARKSLHPMLKVYGKDEYIRADSKFIVTFRR